MLLSHCTSATSAVPLWPRQSNAEGACRILQKVPSGDAQPPTAPAIRTMPAIRLNALCIVLSTGGGAIAEVVIRAGQIHLGPHDSRLAGSRPRGSEPRVWRGGNPRGPAEFRCRNDPYNPSLPVENGNSPDWLVVTRKSDRVSF